METHHEKRNMLTPAEAGAILGLSAKIMYRWAAELKIPSYKVGRSRRFKRRDVEAFLEACRVEAET